MLIIREDNDIHLGNKTKSESCNLLTWSKKACLIILGKKFTNFK